MEDEDAENTTRVAAADTTTGVVTSLTAQCCAFLRTKSFEELGRELGRERIMECEASGTATSSAGKMRRRSGGRQRSWVDVMAGRDYLGQLDRNFIKQSAITG